MQHPSSHGGWSTIWSMKNWIEKVLSAREKQNKTQREWFLMCSRYSDYVTCDIVLCTCNIPSIKVNSKFLVQILCPNLLWSHIRFFIPFKHHSLISFFLMPLCVWFMHSIRLDEWIWQWNLDWSLRVRATGSRIQCFHSVSFSLCSVHEDDSVLLFTLVQ